jgi:catechol 2,3-dioxygenase-like lactoylglutathione lyase family enzyme
VIGRMHHVVIDCPDPAALAAFYSELLGLAITYRSDDWVVIAKNDTTSGVAFQRVPDYQPPQWPTPDRPQQFHLDVMVDDLPVAEARVISLGARPLRGGDHVFADPAGHPFCLIPRPAWAPPITQATSSMLTSKAPTARSMTASRVPGSSKR